MKPREGAPPAIRKIVDDYRGIPITKISIARKPVQKGISKFFDAVSLGNFGKTKKKLGYDDVYHNYLLITLANGKMIKLEKNQVVQSSEASPDDYKSEHRDIPVDKNVDLNQFIDASARKDPKGFWHYKPDSANCQNFTEDLVRDNGFDRNITDQRTKEILDPQDGKALIHSLGKLEGVPQRVTDLAAGFDRAIHGSGFRLRGGKLTVKQLFGLANRA